MLYKLTSAVVANVLFYLGASFVAFDLQWLSINHLYTIGPSGRYGLVILWVFVTSLLYFFICFLYEVK